MPFAIGRAIKDGIVESDNAALARWAVILLALGAVQAVAGVIRHRFAGWNWLRASFRLAQVVSHHTARAGPAVGRAFRTVRSWPRSRTIACAQAARSTSPRALPGLSERTASS